MIYTTNNNTNKQLPSKIRKIILVTLSLSYKPMNKNMRKTNKIEFTLMA